MFSPDTPLAAHLDLIRTARGRRFGTILADPPWQFQNRTGKVAPDALGRVGRALPALSLFYSYRSPTSLAVSARYAVAQKPH